MDKKQIKISLGTIIYIVIIIFLIILLGVVYYLGFIKKDDNKIKPEEKELASLKIELAELKKENEQLQQQIKTEENKIENEDENEYISNLEYNFNGQITRINEETKKLNSENPKIAFEFPKSWTIFSTKNKESWGIEINSPQAGVFMRIRTIDEEISKDKKLKDIDILDGGSEIIEEGEIKISNYNGYYKEYYFGDALCFEKSKAIIIKTENNQYYRIYCGVYSDEEEHEYSKQELEEIFEKNEPVFDNILSSLEI